MSNSRTITFQSNIPADIFDELERLVVLGWYRNMDEVLLDALQRFLESHRAELMEAFIREDVEWGLYGKG